LADPDAGSLPGEGGAYALYFELSEPVALPIARLNNPVLDPGVYVYAGSACGPGGIRARVTRHLRRDKRPHWHIDHLSVRVGCRRVDAFPGGKECDLVADFLEAGGYVPVPGFGSSDCKTCAAHLVRLAGE